MFARAATQGDNYPLLHQRLDYTMCLLLSKGLTPNPVRHFASRSKADKHMPCCIVTIHCIEHDDWHLYGPTCVTLQSDVSTRKACHCKATLAAGALPLAPTLSRPWRLGTVGWKTLLKVLAMPLRLLTPFFSDDEFCKTSIHSFGPVLSCCIRESCTDVTGASQGHQNV